MLQIQDFNWNIESSEFFPELKLLNLETKEFIGIPLDQYQFDFRLSNQRYCTGFFKDNYKYPCVQSDSSNLPTTILKGVQCSVCEKIDGFKDVFFRGETPNESMKNFLEEIHVVYLAYFPPNILKVGTAIKRRIQKRLLEQDALVSTILGEAKGINILESERFFSKKFNLTTSVKSNHKLKFLSFRIDVDIVEKILRNQFLVFQKSRLELSKIQFNLYDNFELVNNMNSRFYFRPIDSFDQINEPTILQGGFLGMRGRYIFLKNNTSQFFDKEDVIGRVIV